MNTMAAPVETPKTWTSEAGPRQTKQVDEAIRKLVWAGKSTRHITDHGTHISMNIFGQPSEECMTALATIGEKWSWQINRKNYTAIIADLQTATANLVLPEEDERTTAEERAEQAAWMSEANAKRREHDAACKASIGAIMAKWPAGADAIVLALHDQDDSDPMTDYCNHNTTKRVAIGFRRGAREDFKQLRAAAAKFDLTAHLAPGCDIYTAFAWREADQGPSHYRERVALLDGATPMRFLTNDQAEAHVRTLIEIKGNTEQEPILNGIFAHYAAAYGYEIHMESVEHRETYSMGAGNYLKAGHDDCTGWRVISIDRGSFERYSYVVEDAIPAPQASQSAETSSPVKLDKAEVQRHFHTKRQTDFWLVVLKDRVERDEFDRLRDACKRAGGWYSRQWGSTPGGFAFDEESAAIEFAASL